MDNPDFWDAESENDGPRDPDYEVRSNDYAMLEEHFSDETVMCTS